MGSRKAPSGTVTIASRIHRIREALNPNGDSPLGWEDFRVFAGVHIGTAKKWESRNQISYDSAKDLAGKLTANGLPCTPDWIREGSPPTPDWIKKGPRRRFTPPKEDERPLDPRAVNGPAVGDIERSWEDRSDPTTPDEEGVKRPNGTAIALTLLRTLRTDGATSEDVARPDDPQAQRVVDMAARALATAVSLSWAQDEIAGNRVQRLKLADMFDRFADELYDDMHMGDAAAELMRAARALRGINDT